MNVVNTILLSILLGACATTNKLDSHLDYWIGKTEVELVSMAGVPDSTYKTDTGIKILKYKTHGFDCEIDYTINPSGIITMWQHHGDWCVSD